MANDKMIGRKFTFVMLLITILFAPSSANICSHGNLSGDVSLGRSASGSICTLVKVSADGKSIAPIGRSYDKKDWEPVAGPYSSLKYICDGICLVSLPSLEAGEFYKLSIYSHSLAKEDELARFLEQATFGTTREALNEFNSKSDTMESIAGWIHDQIYRQKATLHREWFRRHANHRYDLSKTVRPYNACEKNTRWRKYAISSNDHEKMINLKKFNNKVLLSIDGYVRTVVDTIDWYDSSYVEQYGHLISSDNSYEICSRPVDCIGCEIKLLDPISDECVPIQCNGIYGNPPILFYDSISYPSKVLLLPEDYIAPINEKYFENEFVQEMILAQNLEDDICEDIVNKYDSVPVFGLRLQNGDYFIHDPPPFLMNNTLSGPILNGGSDTVSYSDGKTLCSNAPRTFLNSNQCQLSTDITSCGMKHIPTLDITLNHESLRIFHTKTLSNESVETRYIYAVDQLRIDSNTDSPCKSNSKSRWILISDVGLCMSNSLSKSTKNFISELLRKSSDTNPHMRDIFTQTAECDAKDTDVKGFDINVDGACFRHVHHEHLQVFDFTYWAYDDTHPGNSNARNPIKEIANDGGTTLNFPSWHTMNRWTDNKAYFTEIGRFGDTISFSNLPGTLRLDSIIEAFGESQFTNAGAGIIICGSPGEVANFPLLGGIANHGAFDFISGDKKKVNSYVSQRETVWTMISLFSPDQLRQRMAWSLSQILAIDFSQVSTRSHTEMATAFYDILVRNAFGNYRDILKEISYSVIMAESLSFKKSKSTFYNWSRFGSVTYPDENFSREIMQLFTVGLCRLDIDGIEFTSENGECEPVYNNDDIIEYARVWTGFNSNEPRGNIEYENNNNQVDPMKIEVSGRDMFPKMGLNRQYIGDRYALCVDRPKYHFLKKKAKYRLLGSSSFSELISDPPEWAIDVNAKRLILEKPSSQLNAYAFLYTHLCNQDGHGKCQPKNMVDLENDLKCHGVECEVDTFRTVQVEPGLFYEYVPAPCVNHAFFTKGLKVVETRYDKNALCANPNLEVASSACCDEQTDDGRSSKASKQEIYWGERMTFKTAAARCERINKPVCTLPRWVCNRDVADCIHGPHIWTKASCSIRAKINPENGKVAIVHDPTFADKSEIAEHVVDDSTTYFRVDWKEKFPTPATACGGSEYCSIYNNMCLCEVSVKDKRVFKKMPKTVDEALLKLHVGAYHPKALGLKKKYKQNGIILYYKSKKNKFDETSVFEVIDNFGVKHYLKNMKSIVAIKGNKNLKFRNPPHFMNLVQQELRDAEFETDAALDHYLFHPNTAPFIANLLIQRFGISNPSPNYVRSVAMAFRSGTYNYKQTAFGTGKHGDLAATISAILLHDESRSVTLDKDASHGSLREPILKVLSFMRAMEFKPDNDRPLVDFQSDMNEKIGQMAYNQLSVFSFFRSNNSPPSLSFSSLHSPEAQLNTGPNIISIVDGLYSLIKWGATKHWEGFFYSRGGSKRKDPSDYSSSVGRLTYEPSNLNAEDIVNEMSTLLTSGRMSFDTKKIIVDAYKNESDKTAALLISQQLIASTPEYHSTGLVQSSGQVRPLVPPPIPSTNSYKAIVLLYMSGGVDSFNMLIPNCEPLKSQYRNKRLHLALTSEKMIPITVDREPFQPCSQFSLHYKLKVLQKAFINNKAILFANTGALSRQVDRTNYDKLTNIRLFSHNGMREESQRIDPYNRATTTGVIGRMMDELHALTGENGAPYKVSSIAVDTHPRPLNGRNGISPPPITVKRKGSLVFDPYPWSEIKQWKDVDLFSSIKKLNNPHTLESSIYGKLWSDDLMRSIEENGIINSALEDVTLDELFGDYKFSERLEQVARLIKTKDRRGVDRDAFFVDFGGWDHHKDLIENQDYLFEMTNDALESFSKEMITQGMDNNVALVAISEFSRTLSPNSSGGSDHAWGGNYFMIGPVKGGRILGQFPEDLDGPINVDGSTGRGRLIPTTSWDAIWNGISQWMGVEDEATLDRILPNRKNCGSNLFTKRELFVD